MCKPGRLWPLYSSSTETKAHACFFIPTSVLVSIVIREQQKQFGYPDIINSELKSSFGDSRRADENPVLAAGDLWSAAISLVSPANKNSLRNVRLSR
jgi:hypothetical protein